MPEGGAQPVALVVDDDPCYRTLMCQLLERAGFAVIVASNGRLALVALERHAVRLLVTDLVMPELPGLELIELARRAFPALRIVAVSGSEADYLRLAQRAGADAVLAKPFRGSALIQAALPASCALPVV
jgi:CheY-like chemotaxis protein